jgi:hypothetical protein
MPFETLDSVDSVYCACSAEFYDDAVLAIGTYQIAEDEAAPVNAESPATKRLGRCLVYDTRHATLSVLDPNRRFATQRAQAPKPFDWICLLSSI